MRVRTDRSHVGTAPTDGLTGQSATCRSMTTYHVKVLTFAVFLCIPRGLQAIPQPERTQQLSSGAPSPAQKRPTALLPFSAIGSHNLVPPQSNDGGVSDLINAQVGNYQEAAFCLDKPIGAYQDPGGNSRCFYFCTGFQGLGFTTCCAWSSCYSPPVLLFPFGFCGTCPSPPPPSPPPPSPPHPPPPVSPTPSPSLCPTCVQYFGNCEDDVRYATECGATGGCRYEDTGECQQLSGSTILVPVCNFICLAPSPFLPPSPPAPPVFPFPPLSPSPPPPPPSPPPGAPSACGTCADLGPVPERPQLPHCLRANPVLCVAVQSVRLRSAARGRRPELLPGMQ
eukprot:jgi/Botrbrau1/9531/Bobra.0211s0022.1